MAELALRTLVDKLGLEVVAGQGGLDRLVTGGHSGDLLSEVMANAPTGCVWLTIQGHPNVVAVAVLREMAAVIITGGQQVDPETKQKAEAEGIPLLAWPGSGFELAGHLYATGVGNAGCDTR